MKWEPWVSKDALHDDYVLSLKKAGIDRRSTETELGMFIMKMLPTEAITQRKTVNGKRLWGWTLSDLPTCRRRFDLVTNSLHAWPPTDDTDDIG